MGLFVNQKNELDILSFYISLRIPASATCLMPVAGGRVVSLLDCYAEGLPSAEICIYGEQQLATMLAGVTPEVNLREVYHITLCQVQIRLSTLVQSSGISDPIFTGRNEVGPR